MPEISATDAARSFSDLLDAVEHQGEQFTIVRRGRAIAHLQPLAGGHGRAAKDLLRRHRPDAEWRTEIDSVRGLLELEDRP